MTFKVVKIHGWWVLTWVNPFSDEPVAESLYKFSDVVARISALLTSYNQEAPSVFVDPTIKETST